MRPSSSLKVIIAIFREAMAFPLSVLESRTSFTTYSPAKAERISTIVPQGAGVVWVVSQFEILGLDTYSHRQQLRAMLSGKQEVSECRLR
jgi:hypothetical protein